MENPGAVLIWTVIVGFLIWRASTPVRFIRKVKRGAIAPPGAVRYFFTQGGIYILMSAVLIITLTPTKAWQWALYLCFMVTGVISFIAAFYMMKMEKPSEEAPQQDEEST